MAYKNQGKSLTIVQTIGPKLEKDVRELLGWESGKITYFTNAKYKYDIQSDAIWPNAKNPEVFLSVTYCNPDTPGHSNENKLQLKLGELILFKSAYPNIRSLLVIGGNEEAWLKYVLEVFRRFFDEVVYLWEPNALKRISEIKDNPKSIKHKHSKLWGSMSSEYNLKDLGNITTPVNSYLRENIWKCAKKSSHQKLPQEIENEILRKCMQVAFDRHKATRGRVGSEWTNYREKDWDKLWQSRSFFNPGEAAIFLTLDKLKLSFLGDVAEDVAVPSLIHQFGGANVDNTKVSEDFVLFSNKLNIPIFIQSKASGGGMERHGKNIQNRTKEQITRSLFYRGFVDKTGDIKIKEKDFIWISVLDGDWGVTQRTPLKYMHMLTWAGYDHLVAADSLVNTQNFAFLYPNQLAEILIGYECEKNQDVLAKKWATWLKARRSPS